MQGMKTGGRARGTCNRASKAREEAIATSGMTPLDYLLSVMRDESLSVAERVEAAGKAAQYVHPKLSAVTLKPTMNVHTIQRVIVDPKDAARIYREMMEGETIQPALT